jgi:hypothetical protein
MNLLCKLLGHNFNYYIISASPQKNIRVCRRCYIVQEYKWCVNHMIWMNLVRRTKEGAQMFLRGKENHYFSKEK